MIDPVTNSLLASAASSASGGAPAFNANKTAAPAATSFADALKNAAATSVSAVKQSEATAMNAMHGGASMQEVVQATVAAELAVESAVAVRNKMIESYQEIMRMPI